MQICDFSLLTMLLYEYFRETLIGKHYIEDGGIAERIRHVNSCM